MFDNNIKSFSFLKLKAHFLILIENTSLMILWLILKDDIHLYVLNHSFIMHNSYLWLTGQPVPKFIVNRLPRYDTLTVQ